MSTSLRTLTFSSARFRRSLMLAAALAVVVTLSSMSWATSCNGLIQLTNTNPQITCVMAPSSNETMTVGMQYMSFTSAGQGQVLIYDDALHTQLSDIVTFQNVNGVATITFQSGLDGTSNSSLPVLGSFTEGSNEGYFFLSLALTNGKFLHVGICSGESTACNGGSDSLKLSVGNTAVPEPGTFVMLGTGIIGSLGWVKGAWARRFRNQIRS